MALSVLSFFLVLQSLVAAVVIPAGSPSHANSLSSRRPSQGTTSWGDYSLETDYENTVPSNGKTKEVSCNPKPVEASLDNK